MLNRDQFKHQWQLLRLMKRGLKWQKIDRRLINCYIDRNRISKFDQCIAFREFYFLYPADSNYWLERYEEKLNGHR